MMDDIVVVNVVSFIGANGEQMNVVRAR